METLVKEVGARSGVGPREVRKEKGVILKDRDGRRHRGVLGFLERKNCYPHPESSC